MERSDQGSGESDIGGMSEDTVFKPVQIEKKQDPAVMRFTGRWEHGEGMESCERLNHKLTMEDFAKALRFREKQKKEMRRCQWNHAARKVSGYADRELLICI